MILYLSRLTLPDTPSERHGALSAGVRRLLTLALTEAGHDPASLRLCRTAEGKPYLTAADGSPCSVECSLAHSGCWTVCALAEGKSTPVGVDLEQIRPVSPALWRRYLAEAPDEPYGGDLAAILRWTRYEAALKQVGHAPERMPPEPAFFTLRPIPGYLLTVIGERVTQPIRFVAESRLYEAAESL